MAYFAKINSENIVEAVVSVSNDIAINEQSGIDFLNKIYNEQINWKQTSYNTRGGKYYINDEIAPDELQYKAFRKNYANIGMLYDETRNAFIPVKKPYPSWVLNENTCLFESPVPIPSDFSIEKQYIWNEQNKSWDLTIL
jgi:hypothetical protein